MNMLQRWDPMVGQRNNATNIVLYGVLVASVLFFLFDTLIEADRSIFMLYVAPQGHPLADADMMSGWRYLAWNYSKGYLPGWIISIVCMVCNLRVMQGHRSGFMWMFILLFAVAFSTLFAMEAEAFYIITLSAIIPLAVYFALLFLRKDGRSTWSLCRPCSRWLAVATIITAIVWLMFLVSTLTLFL